MAAQEEERIVKTPEVLGGKPRVAGRRIGVYFLHQRVEVAGNDPHAVADRHGLDVADVYRALAYYHEHPEEMRRIEERRRRAGEEADRRTSVEPPDTGADDAERG